MTIDTLITPAEIDRLPRADLTETLCVVFDVMRATTTMITALANGVAAIRPASTIGEALSVHRAHPETRLAGERHGRRITRATGSEVDFHFGNSPREFAGGAAAGRRLVMTTTNGTRALRACSGAKVVLAGAVVNLGVVAEAIRDAGPASLLLLCSGTGEGPALEDLLGAGMLLNRLGVPADGQTDGTRLALLTAKGLAVSLQTPDAWRHSANAGRLLAIPELADDVAFCLRPDVTPIVGRLDPDGWIRRI